jgi:5-methylcytosine-specific restriction endonuclease McrA
MAAARGRRPKIPEGVKREVRQRCGFGCVICGLPIYEYDHLVPYAQVLSHNTRISSCFAHNIRPRRLGGFCQPTRSQEHSRSLSI